MKSLPLALESGAVRAPVLVQVAKGAGCSANMSETSSCLQSDEPMSLFQKLSCVFMSSLSRGESLVQQPALFEVAERSVSSWIAEGSRVAVEPDWRRPHRFPKR